MKNFFITYTGFVHDHTGDGQERTVRNSPRIEYVFDGEPEAFLDKLFHQTNTYSGEIYEALIASGHEPRALSVGDIVSVDITRYIVCGMGFAKVDVW